MRKDEDYVKKSLEKYFESISKPYLIIEGEDPPDFYVIYENRKILLEATQARPVYQVGEGNIIENRTTFENSVMTYLDRIRKEIDNEVDSKYTISMHVEGPLKDYSSFKKSLKRKALEIIKDDEFLKRINMNYTEVQVGNDSVLVTSWKRQKKESVFRFSVGIKGTNAIFNINEQLEIIVDEILRKKEEKTKMINGYEWVEEKWLAILNGYVLSSVENYVNALCNIKTGHSFSKIFLIEPGNYFVQEIYP